MTMSILHLINGDVLHIMECCLDINNDYTGENLRRDAKLKVPKTSVLYIETSTM